MNYLLFISNVSEQRITMNHNTECTQFHSIRPINPNTCTILPHSYQMTQYTQFRYLQ